MTKKVAINVEIKNIKKVADLKKELQGLRKEQKEAEKQAKTGQFTSKKAEKQYIANAKAIKGKSKSLRDLNKSLSQSDKDLKKTTKTSNSLSRSFVKAAAAIGIVVGAFRLVSRALTSIISTFTEFEFVMAKVNAVSGASSSEFAKLTASAEELGRTTFFTATQVGELQLAFSKLGFTSAEILDATKATLDLATSTGTDLARAAQVAGASIRGFQLDASEAGRVVDVMAVAFASSALDIEKWNTSMTKVAPIAAMAGFEIEEVAAIMGKLTDTGIEASIAGTSLRNIFLKMQDPASDLTKRVGHTITNLDEMLIAFKGLQDEGTDLADVLTFMDIRQVAAFGTMLEGSDDIATLRDALLEATGEGERMADMVGDTLQGAFLKFKSAIQGLSIEIMRNLGDSMKKSIVGMSKWLNTVAQNSDAITSMVNGIVTLAKWIRTAIKVFLAWKIGIYATMVAVELNTARLWLQAFGMEAVTLATGKAKVAMVAFSKALARTGVGLLILAVIDLVFYMKSFNDEMNAAADSTLAVESAGQELLTNMKELEEWEKKLIKARKTQKELLKDNGELIEDTAENTYKLKEAQQEEKTAINNLNKALKQEKKDLIGVKTATEDVIEAMDELTRKVGKNALARIYLEQENMIIRNKVQAEQAMQEMRKMMTAEFNFFRDMTDKELLTVMNKLKKHDGSFGMWVHELVSSLGLTTSEVKVKELINDIMDKYSVSLGTLIDAGGGDYIDRQTKLLKDSLNKLAGELDIGDFNLADALADLEEKTEKKKTGPKSAQFLINEKIKAREETFKINNANIQDEKDYQAGLLQAKIDGVNDYLAQENNKKEGITAANIQLADLLRKQRKANDAQTLEDLRVDASAKLTIAKELLADKTYTEYQYALVVHEVNKKLLQDEFNLLTEKEKLGKKGADIKAKLATLELNLVKTNITEEERLLTKAHNEKVRALELEQATTMMGQIEFDNRMLQLEADFLAKKAELHAGNALVLIDINNDILKNNIKVNDLQKQMMEEQISAMGGVGSALTSLAGDNEKLNFIKEAGNKISQVANIISAVTTLRADLETLSTIKKNAAKIIGNTTEEASILLDKQKIVTTNIKTGAENLNTGANITNTVSEGANTAATLAGTIATTLSLIPKAISAILTSAMALPFPINLVAIVATMALVRKVMKFEEGGIVGNKYANGGMVHGKSHAQGGEKFAVGGRVVELEGGEAVINKRSTAKYKSQLSAMNADGGGVKFADGGLLNSPAFAQQQFSMDRRGGGAQKVYVVESDISRTQKSVNVLEAAATL